VASQRVRVDGGGGADHGVGVVSGGMRRTVTRLRCSATHRS
jgi:hypothetical protein